MKTLWKDQPRVAPDTTSYRPTIFDPTRESDADALSALFASAAPPTVHDMLGDQLHELVRSLNPSDRVPPEEHARLAHERLEGREECDYGRWVHYPWSNRLVHVLPPDEYAFLRSDRNRYKITPAGQASLRARTIGVVGLSVGHATILTLVMEGVGGRFRLADFDTLSLSNMNRLRTNVCNVGISKTIIAAREMFEIDPYLDITLFDGGINDANIDRFFGEGGQLDLLVEECDDLYAKIALRERAKALGVPVITETSDRGMLDVERFDLEPSRPIYHGVLGELPAAGVRNLTPSEKMSILLRMVDARAVSPELAASLPEVKETIHTWPQLASSVALGGAVVTDAARRIFLDTFRASGRFYVDLTQIVSDAGAHTPEARAPLEPSIAAEATETPHIARPARVDSGPLTEAEARYLIAHAALAPSGGNAQPWRFEFRGDTCDGIVDAGESSLDVDDAASTLSLGAAAENMALAARAIGVTARFDPFPDARDSRRVFRAHFARDAAAHADPEFEWVTRRVTNRRRAPRAPLSEAQSQQLTAAAESRGLRLRFVTEAEPLGRLAGILGKGDRLRFLSPPMHSELVGELRWSPDEVTSTRTGIDIASLELPHGDQAAMRVFTRPDVMRHLRSFDGGRALAKPAFAALAGSSAVGLLSIDGAAPRAYFDGGRGVEHVWLVANALGLAFQPYTALVYLFKRLESRPGDLGAWERATLAALRTEYLAIFEGADKTHELMLFRLAHTDAPPTARSLRRTVDSIATFR